LHEFLIITVECDRRLARVLELLGILTMNSNASPDNQQPLVELVKVYNDVEASLIQSLLAESGIDCLLVSHVPHSIYPFTINGLGEVRIKVLEDRLAEAREILRESGRIKIDEDMDSEAGEPAEGDKGV